MQLMIENNFKKCCHPGDYNGLAAQFKENQGVFVPKKVRNFFAFKTTGKVNKWQ